MKLKLSMFLVSAATIATAEIAHAQGTLSQDEALRLAFPAPAQIERRTAYLDDTQAAQVKKLAGRGIDVAQRVVTYYTGIRNGGAIGVAYFDTHRVRTLNEVLMIVVGLAGDVQRIEVLRFAEPPEYKAGDRWLDQFEGETLTPDLSLKKGIVNMTGATLTSSAVTKAVRRVLAFHAVIQPFKTTK